MAHYRVHAVFSVKRICISSCRSESEACGGMRLGRLFVLTIRSVSARTRKFAMRRTQQSYLAVPGIGTLLNNNYYDNYL